MVVLVLVAIDRELLPICLVFISGRSVSLADTLDDVRDSWIDDCDAVGLYEIWLVNGVEWDDGDNDEVVVRVLRLGRTTDLAEVDVTKHNKI